MRPSILHALLLAFLAAIVAFPGHAAQKPKPRPYTGTGVVFIRPFTPERKAELAAIPLYREPGVGRIADFAAERLPQLTPFLTVPAGTYAVAVMAKRGNWLEIAYDDSGRTGWLERDRWWDYLPWDEYLPGRLVGLVPGLKTGSYRLCPEPGGPSLKLEPLTPKTPVRVTRVQGDWLKAALPPATPAWLRWRDNDGRLLITTAERIPHINY